MEDQTMLQPQSILRFFSWIWHLTSLLQQNHESMALIPLLGIRVTEYIHITKIIDEKKRNWIHNIYIETPQ